MSPRRYIYNFGYTPLLFTKALIKSKEETVLGQDILGFVQILMNSLGIRL